MDPFVSQLAGLCGTHKTRAKWVFVQSHAVGRTIGERIVLEGTNWANLRFVTPLDIAVRMAGPFLVERGIAPSEDGLGPALIMRLLLDLGPSMPAAASRARPPASDPKRPSRRRSAKSASTPLFPDLDAQTSDDALTSDLRALTSVQYFRPLAEQPSMAQALWSTIRELRMAGLHARDLPAHAFESPGKHAELTALVAAYERYLETHQVADVPAIYEEAPRHQDYCPILPGDLWIEHPDAIWAPLQRRLLDSLPGQRIAALTVSCAGLPEPRRWPMLKGKIESAAHESRTDAARLAFLMRPSGAPEPLNDGTLAMFRAGSRDAEIDEIFRRVVSAKLPLDSVEIACTSDEYAALVWEKALRLDWPVTLGTGIPGALTRPGRALLAWCNWIEGDFAAVDLRHLLQSGDVAMNLPVDLAPGKASRLLARAEATWGRQTYALALERLRQDYARKARDEERSAELREAAAENAAACAALEKWIAGLLDNVPEPGGGGTLPLGRLTAAAETFVERCSARTSAMDHLARERLIELVGELHALDSFPCTLAQGLGFIRERVGSLAVAADRARPGALHVSTPSQAAYPARSHLFVVGLEEGRVFPSRAEDSVLLDAERAAISPRLRTANDRVDELQHQIVTRLASAGGRVCLSYACRDTREYRETLPSWVLLQACRVAAGNPALGYDGLIRTLGEPVSCVPGDVTASPTETGWWLAGVKGNGASGRKAVLDRFAAIARGIEAEDARGSGAFSEFDGFAPAAGAALDPSRNGTPISPTTLEDAAKCPYRFFLQRGLRIEPVPDAVRDRDAWLTPLVRGAELHDLYAELMRRCRAEGRRPDVRNDAWILELAANRLGELTGEMPPPSPEVFERERRDFLRDVELFVAFEASWDGGNPVALEVSFGRRRPGGSGNDDEPLARAEPVEVDLGDGRALLLSGRIDRIDRVGASLYDIVDYKTGLYWRDDWKGTFAGGTRLQHALYALAARELLRGVDAKARIRQGVYFFASARGGHERKPIERPADGEIATVVNDLLDVIAAGAFVHTRDEGHCTFCDFTAACGVRAVERANVKLENPAEKRLDAYRRLERHE